jgi:hypothetical protein
VVLFGWGRFVPQNHSRPNGGCSDEREQSQDDNREWKGAHAVILAGDPAQQKKGTPATAIHVAVYNSCGIHSSIRLQREVATERFLRRGDRAGSAGSREGSSPSVDCSEMSSCTTGAGWGRVAVTFSVGYFSVLQNRPRVVGAFEKRI